MLNVRLIFKEGLLVISILLATIGSVIALAHDEQSDVVMVKATQATTPVMFQTDDKDNPPLTTTTTIPPTTTTTQPSPPTTVAEVRRSGSVNWDAIADCESGGNWHINTGNGYYGGLQFDLQTWQGTGGSGYPHEHSREEQIHRAEILYASRGVAPWPTCGKYG